MIAQVIVDVVHTNVARPFSYLVPDGMSLCVGSRVRVPLGRRQVDGFVVALDGQTDVPAEKLRTVAKVLDPFRPPCARDASSKSRNGAPS